MAISRSVEKEGVGQCGYYKMYNVIDQPKIIFQLCTNLYALMKHCIGLTVNSSNNQNI